MSNPAVQGDSDAPNPTQRPASPAKRSAATMEGVDVHQDRPMSDLSQDAPPQYDAHQQDARPSPPPSIEEQIAHITSLLKSPIQEGSKGFVVATKWLNRVMARANDANQKDFDADALEGEIGKVDNSSVVLPGAFDNPIVFSGSPDQPFIPLRADVERHSHYEIFTEEAWRQVVDWYGLADGQVPITRFVIDSAPPGSSAPNLLYEINPPVFTVRKVPFQSVTSDASAPKLVASRTERFQTFLARAKTAAGISIQHKVKIFRQLDSTKVSGDMPNTAQPGVLSPPTSRNPSPSPTTSPKLVADLANWTEGVNFESVDAQDHTANEKYNGKSTLDLLGLIADQTLILEEQLRGPGGGEFASEARKKQNKNSTQSSQNETVGRRASPAPSGPVTRGRTRKDGRARGAIGLTNLGNTCYMNSALQCISRVEELAVYFLQQKHKTEINADNPLGYNGKIANSYANLLAGIYSDNATSAFRPSGFKGALSMAQPMFSGYGQQDSQEFLSFLVDALHEDLNRIQKKPYIENPDSDDSTVHDPEAIRQLGEKYRENHRARNDSIAMDLFNGFYKNTMVCPDCDKVSVTFDPYSLLTLQLPIENTWQGKVMYMPVNGYPSTFEIDVDKNTSVKALKDFFVAKVGGGLTRDRLIFAEIFSHRFYKIMYDNQTISEAGIEARDILCMYELPDVPTNAAFAPKKQTTYRSIYDQSSDDPLPSMDSPLAETMAIPVLHSRGESRTASPSLTLNPTFITVTKEEAKDYNAVLTRVLASIAPMTSKRFLEEVSEEQIQQIAANADETQPDQVEGTDVSMREGSETPSKQPLSILQPGSFIPAGLRNLFELKYIRASSDMFLTGTGGINNTRPILNRVRVADQRRGSTSSAVSVASRGSRDSGYSGQNRSSTESDEDADPAIDSFQTTDQSTFSGDVQSDEESGMASLEGLAAKQGRRSKYNKKFKKTYGRKGARRNRRQSVQSNASRTSAVDTSADDNEYYIRLGEGIIVDWQTDAFDSLFGGGEENGHFTFDEKHVPLVDDPELQTRRNKRLQRRKNGITLDDCFNETGKTEVLSEDNAWYCNRCKELRRASKTLELWTVPDILVVHLKRFSGERFRRDKVDVLVDFPLEGLDLTRMVGCKEEDKEYVYDLFAVDNHYGGLGGGHYTAYAKNFYDGKWYDFNDSSVSHQNPGSVVSTAAYLLFYRRRSSKPLGPPELQELVLKARNPDEASDVEDESGEGARLGDNSSASSRLLGSSNAGAVGAGAAITGTLQQGANGDGPGRGANRGVKLMSDIDDDEGIALNDEIYGNDNNTTAVTLANPEATWGFDGLGDDDNNTYVNTPADTASDRPDIGSDDGDRFRDFEDDNDQSMLDLYRGDSPPPLEDEGTIIIEGQKPSTNTTVTTTVEEKHE